MRLFLGASGQVRNVREFVAGVVGATPIADDVVLLACELATNAVRHTASGDGGTFRVVVQVASKWVRVEVHDAGSDTMPNVRLPAPTEESGAGLYLIDAIAARWGHRGGRTGRVVWFEVEW
jgi:anti-sigma regulatory factor (Ser/Thr protein kinase)